MSLVYVGVIGLIVTSFPQTECRIWAAISTGRRVRLKWPLPGFSDISSDISSDPMVTRDCMQNGDPMLQR